MYPFIVVDDGAYGISFDIVMADSAEEAWKLSGHKSKYENWVNVIDLRWYASRRNEVVYSENPTGG